MIGQKNLGVKHFFLRATRVQVLEILNLDHGYKASKNTSLSNLVHTDKIRDDCGHNGAEFVGGAHAEKGYGVS